MTSRNWKDTAELLGVVAIVLSLIFVGIQLQLDRNVSIVEARSELTGRVISLSEMVSSGGDLWQRGLENEELSSVDELRFIAMAGAVRSHFFTLWVRWSRIGPVDPNLAPQSLAYALYAHPGLRRVIQSQAQFRRDRDSAFGSPVVGTEFYALVDRYLAELDASEIVPNRDYLFW